MSQVSKVWPSSAGATDKTRTSKASSSHDYYASEVSSDWSSSHTLQAPNPSSSSEDAPTVTLNQKAPFGHASSRKRKTEIPEDSSSSSSLLSSSSSSDSNYSASNNLSGKKFKLVSKPFYKSIHRAYKSLDMKLSAADVNSSNHRSIFKSLNEKMKVLLHKSEQSHHGDKVRKNFM